VVLSPLERAHHRGDDLKGELAVARGQGLETASAVYDDRGLPNRLRREAMLLARLNSEDIAGNMDASICRRPSSRSL
jgi:hypothetical protein